MKERQHHMFLIILFILILAALLGFGIWLLLNDQPLANRTIQPEPIGAPSS